jgi:hypothetical protein
MARPKTVRIVLVGDRALSLWTTNQEGAGGGSGGKLGMSVVLAIE